MTTLKDKFLLDPEVIFLNHGSFGSTPRPVFEVYQDWQKKLENQPVEFLIREFFGHLRSAREGLGAYLGADSLNLAFIPNTTFGVNIIARSLNFDPGDEILISNHEYGACDNVFSFLGQKYGVKVLRQNIPLPLPTTEEVLELFWDGVTGQTKLIFLSQITSSTAIRLPIENICKRAKEAGIQVLIDGAHAPGQINLDLEEIGADFYTGNCHKWLMAPKGSAFLYVKPDKQDLVEPLVVSWGWGENCPYESDSRFLALLEWWGTKDPAAYLSVPAAIQFQEDQQWEKIQEKCCKMLSNTLSEIEILTGLPSIYGKNRGNYVQFATAELPGDKQPQALQEWLFKEYKIEIPVIEWEGRWFIRPSVQGYNTKKELDILLIALEKYLK